MNFLKDCPCKFEMHGSTIKGKMLNIQELGWHTQLLPKSQVNHEIIWSQLGMSGGSVNG